MADDARVEGDDVARRVDRAVRSLQGDKAARNTALDSLAALAPTSQVALKALLRAVLDLRLAERPVMTVLLDRADIDDAVQRTLIVIAEKVSGFEGRSQFATWVDRVAHNEALMVVRRKTRKSEPSTHELPEGDRLAKRLSSLVADEHDFNLALQSLSAEQRQVLEMREVAGYSYEEIAQRLDVPIGTVRSRISRSRNMISDYLLARRWGAPQSADGR